MVLRHLDPTHLPNRARGPETSAFLRAKSTLRNFTSVVRRESTIQGRATKISLETKNGSRRFLYSSVTASRCFAEYNAPLILQRNGTAAPGHQVTIEGARPLSHNAVVHATRRTRLAAHDYHRRSKNRSTRLAQRSRGRTTPRAVRTNEPFPRRRTLLFDKTHTRETLPLLAPAPQYALVPAVATKKRNVSSQRDEPLEFTLSGVAERLGILRCFLRKRVMAELTVVAIFRVMCFRKTSTPAFPGQAGLERENDKRNRQTFGRTDERNRQTIGTEN